MEERKLVWNPFKKDYWRKDNLIPPEKRETIRQNTEQMKTAWTDSKKIADEMFGKTELEPKDVTQEPAKATGSTIVGTSEKVEAEAPPVETAAKPRKKKRVVWRLVWTIGLTLILTVLFGPIGTGIGAIIFIVGLIGLIRK